MAAQVAVQGGPAQSASVPSANDYVTTTTSTAASATSPEREPNGVAVS